MPTLIKRSNGIFYQVSYQTGRRIWRSTGVRTRSTALKAIEDGLDRSKPKRSITMAGGQDSAVRLREGGFRRRSARTEEISRWESSSRPGLEGQGRS